MSVKAMGKLLSLNHTQATNTYIDFRI